MLRKEAYIKPAIFFVLVFVSTYLLPAMSWGGKRIIIFDKPAKRDSMKKSKVAPVVFPHLKHKEMYKCQSCHRGIFKSKLGANKMSMQTIIEGKHCGKCHNGFVAFSPLDCKSCHFAEEIQ